MRLELTRRHVTITDPMRELVEEHTARLDRLLNDAAVSMHVVLSLEKGRHCSDMRLHARDDRVLHGAGDAPNWEASIKAASDKVAHQAQTLKGKWESRHRRGSKPDSPPPSIDSENPASG